MDRLQPARRGGLHLQSHRNRAAAAGLDYALVPVNGKLPMKPMPISPEMASPATVPLNSSVSGIGLVMETFHATSLPVTLPSKISTELPSAPCVPESVPPALFRFSVALRSPIGVVMVRFQFPSTAILSLLVMAKGLARRYSLFRRGCLIGEVA